MSDPVVTIRLDGNGRVYRPGETLSGQYRIESADAVDRGAGAIKAVEVSVLWYSEGKGDEDLAVHEFRRYGAENGDAVPSGQQGNSVRTERFSTTLPHSPLSYDGVILKLRWCVRVRAFLARGKEVVGQKEFQLGNVLAAKVLPL